MKKLTKEAAANIAAKMADSVFGEKIEMAENLLQSKTTEMAFLRVPDEIGTAFKNYPRYFATMSSVRFKSDELKNFEWYYVEAPVPTDQNWVEVPLSDYEQIIGLQANLNRISKERNKFKSELFETLYTLGTEKRISEHLPEALPFIPERTFDPATPATLALPIENLRKILQK